MTKLMKFFAAVMLIVSVICFAPGQRGGTLRLLQGLRPVGRVGLGPVGSRSWVGAGQPLFLRLQMRVGPCSRLA